MMNNDVLLKSMDTLWDGWLNSFKLVQEFQDEVEKKAIQAVESQKEWLKSTVSTLNSIEEESKKASKEWQDKVKVSLNEMNKNKQLDQVTNWLDSLQDINEKVQSFTWKPNHAILDLLENSQEQWEATAKKAIEHQKQERSEAFKKIEELAGELKETHKRLLAVGKE